MSNPLGDSITCDEIKEDLQFFDDWEERYRYIIDLGKVIPAMDASLKNEDRLIRGCQSRVWLEASYQDDRLTFEVDSDALIVRGLLAVVLSAYNGKSPKAIVEYNIDDYFSELDLMSHLSQTRGNGLREIVKKIRSIANAKLAGD